MLRAVLVAMLISCAKTAQAQREPPPAPLEAEPPAPDTSAPGTTTTPPDEEPRAPTATGTPAPTNVDDPRVSQHRYEGQVSSADASPAYDEDLDKDEDKAARRNQRAGIPGFSIRIDPFNWLIEGRLGFEIEVVAWKFISVEAVPVFVVNNEPPAFNFAGRDDPISQRSNGLGPIAGSSIGAGFWLSGTPFQGYVLRAILTNYGLMYKASDRTGTFDRVSHTERRLLAFVGSHSRFGFFTISGGIGLGYELNQQQRCFANLGSPNVMSATSGCPDSSELQILLDPEGRAIANLNGGLHPVYIVGRFSLGVAFD